jgi:signal transduction histidine kinase
MTDPVFGEAAATEAYRTRAPTWKTGLRRDRSRGSHLESVVLPRPWRAVLSVPIVHEDETLGVLSCYLRNAQRFDPDEIARIEALAALASVAITNASAYGRERQALESLRELDAMKDDFLSTISHELRTPLTAVEGFATTLMRRWEEIPETTRRDFVGRIERQATSLHGLIRELLDFSRLQSGSYTIRVAPIQVQAYVNEIVTRLESTLQPHAVKLDIDEGVLCWADPMAIERILENLLTNAARYSPPDAPILVRGDVVGNWVDVSVTDEGLGIPQEELGRIFQRFYRGASDQVRSIHGTGVGLAVVKELVEAHGGSVAVESTPGAGSTFTVKLPARPPRDHILATKG